MDKYKRTFATGTRMRVKKNYSFVAPPGAFVSTSSSVSTRRSFTNANLKIAKLPRACN